MKEEIIKKIDYFPPFPATLNNALQVVNSPSAGTDDILEAIRYDVALTTNLLKLCNSPLYSFRREISSVREAIVYAGVNEIKKMVLFMASREVFSTDSPGYESHRGEMFKHSIATAIISNGLAPFAPELPADLFTTCLMLDVGKIILSDYVGKSYSEISRLVVEKQMDFSEAEAEVLGVTHPEVGGEILKKWAFPGEMVTAVRFHHTPEAVPDSPLTHFASLSSTLAMISGLTTGVDGMAYKGFPDLCRRYKIKNADISNVLSDSLDKIQTILGQMGVS